ncbi:MAG: hypothetical protein M3459_03920 [Actinomycetota bacterium]|nr:hypothetical protein [Actinomycetota bacterium]
MGPRLHLVIAFVFTWVGISAALSIIERPGNLLAIVALVGSAVAVVASLIHAQQLRRAR